MDIQDIQKAAKDGHAAHQVYLARLHLMGAGVARDVPAAMSWLNQAIAQNDGAAYTERAAIRIQGFDGEIDQAGAWQDLQRAAHLGEIAAQRQVGLLCYAFGQKRAGEALLGAAAKRGDEAAQILLADILWKRGDDAATFWYARAQNNPLADWRMRSRKLAVPKGPSPSVPDLPEDVWQDVAKTDPFQLARPRRKAKYSHPKIYIQRRAVRRPLCRYVMAVGAGLIRPSEVVDTDTGKAKLDPYRTGYLHQFVPGLCDFTVALFDTQIAAHTRTPLKHGEPLTMLVYKPGQEYKPHWDHLVDTMDEAFGRLGRSGNRQYTALVMLDDDFTGGATRFTRLNIDIRLAPGDMLVFCNMEEDGSRCDDAMHAGLPVDSGVKWLASKWIRERDFVM